MKTIVFLSLWLFSLQAAAQEAAYSRAHGESLGQFAARIIPRGKKLVHPVTEGDFGPAKGALLVLFADDEFRPFTGWVLVPEAGGYRRVVLPQPESMWNYTEVQAVFFANADRDSARELLILCEHMTGIGPTGARPFHYTWVYNWNGRAFVYLDKVSARIGTLATAPKVRQRLRTLGYRP
jgi:hypothetical protein